MLKQAKYPLERFFEYLIKREQIRLRKLAGDPWPWTDDKVMQVTKLTNVKRKDDRTSCLLIEEFYTPNFNAPREQILLNCAIARYFGTIEYMRAVGWQTTWDPNRLKKVARDRKKAGERVFTGAYIVPSIGRAGPKENTVVGQVLSRVWAKRAKLAGTPWTAQQPFMEALTTISGYGSFMAKETMLDTRHTSFWPKPPTDMNTWTPMGPGGRRGAARIRGFTDKRPLSEKESLEVCLEVFEQRHTYLPKDFVELELADIQFQFCEFDKIERVRLGQGKAKSKYVPPHLRKV